MASGHVNRIKRPNTWLHRPMLQNVKKALANPEPSTHDPRRTSCSLRRCQCLHLHETGCRKHVQLWILTEGATMTSPHTRAM
jgi:hypothetical protein